MNEATRRARPSRPPTRIDQIVGGIYRISTFVPASGITFNQFLIDDERPALIHTGHYEQYEAVRAAIADVLDPARLAYVVMLHFEADECGGMTRFHEQAPGSVLVGSALSVEVNLRSFGYSGELLGVQDGDTLALGRHRLRFLETPHVHHWDSMMIFEESSASVFPADLYAQPGEQPPIVAETLADEMCAFYRAIGIFAAEQPVRAAVSRLEALEPQWMHAMHGGTLTAEALPRYTHALREQRFAYQGRLLGRELCTAPGSATPDRPPQPDRPTPPDRPT